MKTLTLSIILILFSLNLIAQNSKKQAKKNNYVTKGISKELLSEDKHGDFYFQFKNIFTLKSFKSVEIFNLIFYEFSGRKE